MESSLATAKPAPPTAPVPWPSLHGRRFRPASVFFTALTGFATVAILAILAIILGNIILNGLPSLSWRFVSTIPRKDFFDVNSAAILPMIVGTTIRVLVMTFFVINSETGCS